MAEFLKSIYDVEGPLGIPMKNDQAALLENTLRSISSEDQRVLTSSISKATTELMEGERSDVSWISTEHVDRDKEVVLSSGMNDEFFKLNPIVTMQHRYYETPVGKSLWRKKVRDGEFRGIKAKTQYPKKPDGWGEESWPADEAFMLVKAGLLLGKSISFISTKSHSPTPEEAKKHHWENVSRVIDEWVLLEYACCFIPAQQFALVDAVSKGLVICKAWSDIFVAEPGVAFTSLCEIEKSISRQIDQFDMTSMAKNAIQNSLNRHIGRV